MTRFARRSSLSPARIRLERSGLILGPTDDFSFEGRGVLDQL
jgi:hypothetical protein